MKKINKKILTVGALSVATVLGAIGGSSFLTTQQTYAADPTPTQAAQPPSQPDRQFNPEKGGHVGKNGTREELLTGDTAQKVTEAALKANPGGTIERVETDAEGSPYEAHMKKSDGTRVTVKVDSNFNVTATEDGPMK